MTKPSTYLPLPKQVKIGTSKIHGMGIFAVEDIKKGTEHGITFFYTLDEYKGVSFNTNRL